MSTPQSVLSALVAVTGVAISCCTLVPAGEPPSARTQASPAVIAAARDSVPGEEYVPYDYEPEIVSMNQPQYPAEARETGQEGTVLCRVYVDATGRVIKTRVLEGVSTTLDAAALRAARTAVFKPALRKDGSTVAAWMVIPVEFKLH
jgi:TonB family protein